MFTLAFLIGIYSYIIFSFGLLGILYRPIVIATNIIFVFILVIFLANSQRKFILHKEKLFLIFLILLIIQAVINLIGAIGPELGFDALWYHLMLPKIYFMTHKITYISNGLFYYSAMPKLIEMIYTGELFIGNEVLAKITHFSFGILTCFVLYKTARSFLNRSLSLLTVAVFYANLIVGWESISAYIDLGRTFFEITSFYAFVLWIKSSRLKYLYFCAILTGLAITAKVLAIGSLVIFLVLITAVFLQKRFSAIDIVKPLVFFSFFALIVPMPWFIFSYINTGNPLFPFFSPVYPTHLHISLLNPLTFLSDSWNILTRSPDPISPVYIAFLPLFAFFFKRFNFMQKVVAAYCLLSFFIWYITPQTGGGRFLLPYLPVFSLLSVFTLTLTPRYIKRIAILFILFVTCVSVFYRLGANIKFIPFVFGRETKREFLSNHLNFHYGDFYDTDGFFAKTIKPSDKVLLVGFHNLYYIDFPASLNPRDKEIDFVAVQDGQIPNDFADWRLIHENTQTLVKVYRKSN